MNGKRFMLIALLMGLGTVVFAQAKFVFSPTALPDAVYGFLYTTQTLTVTGGKAPYTFSISAGRLPAGMTLSAAGNLSGTPTAAGAFSITVKAQGKVNGPGPKSGTANYTLTVDPAALTITANNASMTYGGAVPSLTASYSGFVIGDNSSGLNTQPRLSTTAAANSPAGSYPITVSGAADPNYTFTYVKGTMTVGKTALTITADNKTMPFGGPLPILTVSYSGFVNRDNASSLASLPTINTTVSLSSPAGNYPITVSGAKDPNYNFSYVSGTLTISAGTIHVTANPQTKEYGTSDPPFTYTFTGLPNGDSATAFTGSLSRAQGENVSAYPITIGSLSAGAGRTLSFTGSKLTITKATQQITWTQSLIVGCNTTSQLTLTATASSELPVTYSVSDASLASVSGNVLTLLKPGAVSVTAAQSGNADYKAATTVTDTVIVQPASLITQHWNDALFFDNSGGNYIQWQWYKDGAAVAGDTTPYYSETPSLNGQYYVIATNKNGQQVQSCTLTVTPGAAIPGGIKVAPNPAAKGALVTITCNYTVTALQGALIQITDVNGRIVQQITNVQPSTPITMPNANGIYIINLLLPNGQRIATNVLVGG
jgi:MBG domain (YGX type)